MEVQLASPGGLVRQLTVRIPAESVAKAVDERLKRISARAKIPGFRPGKVPFKVIQKQFGESARMEAVSDLVQQSYPQALTQSGVNPAGMPKIDITAEKPGEPLEYVAQFEVYPEFTVTGLDALSVEKPEVDITEADVDRLIDNLRKARRSFVPVSRPAAVGDGVTMNFVGKIDGVAFDGGSAEGIKVELGSGQFLPDLENGIVGHAAGEQFTVPVAFPEDYRAEPLRGKQSEFDVTLVSVDEPQLPAVDDADFLAAHGAESVDALRDKSRTALENEARKNIRARLKAQVVEQIAAANPIDVPAALVEREIPRLRDEAAERMNLRDADAKKREQLLPANLFEAAARRRVQLGLLISEVMRSQNVTLDVSRVDKALEDLSNDFEQPEEVRSYYRTNPELMQNLRAAVLEDQVVESLLEKATVTAKPQSLEELLNNRA
jgi:trigger factor